MKRIALFLMLVAAVAFMFVGCGTKPSQTAAFEILNIEFFGDGRPQIRINDPKEGVRVLRIGDKYNGLEVLEANEDGVYFLNANGKRIYVEK